MHRILSLLCALALLYSTPSPLHAATTRKIALVVGNSKYRNIPQLGNPSNDATLIAQTLKSLGFQIVGSKALIDLDKKSFDGALSSFGQQSKGADVAVFYYAGHGVQYQDINYLLPVDASIPKSPPDLPQQSVAAQVALDYMQYNNVKLKILILDACRSNPFPDGRGISVTNGLATASNLPNGTIVAYATRPNGVAQDGITDSPYSAALAASLRQPGLAVLDMFNRTGLQVQQATNYVQEPWLSFTPLNGTYYFAGAATGAAAVLSAAVSLTSALTAPAVPTRLNSASLARYPPLYPKSLPGFLLQGIECDVSNPKRPLIFTAFFNDYNQPVHLQWGITNDLHGQIVIWSPSFTIPPNGTATVPIAPPFTFQCDNYLYQRIRLDIRNVNFGPNDSPPYIPLG